MPHVEIKCYPGRTGEQKRNCAEQTALVIAETLGCDVSHVTVAIKDVAREDWKSQVWDVSIAPDVENLYKKPGYTCEG
ncbi:MAG: tautomerase family protein [Oscillospiraceae bacterium]|jgi:4-oxalocrotonate tautomerase|nr:tautomerase family protein [Oscillospiraceae bacterium]